MRLLILTQTVDRNDQTLGFFHRWVEEFASQCEHVHVVCLFEGQHSLPINVTVLSLGKEERASRLQYLYRFFVYIRKYRNDYDAVFVHMNQLYVLLGGALWHLWGKRVVLWYAHGAVSASLWLAEKITQDVVTSTTEGFRIPSRKLHVVGQGIDTTHFVRRASGYRPSCIRVIYVGRISPVKHCEVLIDAVAELLARGAHAELTLVGDITASEIQPYYASLCERIRVLGLAAHVVFAGGVPHAEVSRYLCNADVFVNPSETGSLDKAGLEALAAGVPLVTCNEAFAGVLGTYAMRLMFPKRDSLALAARIVAIHRAIDRKEMMRLIAEAVQREHSRVQLIPRVLAVLKKQP